jgi:hypothetical protein
MGIEEGMLSAPNSLGEFYTKLAKSDPTIK